MDPVYRVAAAGSELGGRDGMVMNGLFLNGRTLLAQADLRLYSLRGGASVRLRGPLAAQA